MALEVVGRRIRDAMRRDDELRERPEKTLARLNEAVDKLTPADRSSQLEHLRAARDVYFIGRHNMQPPYEFRVALAALEKRVERLNTVERAREVLVRFGGPPTKETIQEALDRSASERMQKLAASLTQAQKGVGQGIVP